MERVREQRENIVKNRVDDYDKNASRIQTLTTQCLKQEAACSKSFIKLSQGLKEMAVTEKYDVLSTALNITANAIAEIQNHRKTVVTERLGNTMVQRIVENSEMCVKPTKMILNDRNTAVKSMEKARRKYDSLSARASESKILGIKTKIQDELNRIKDIDDNLEEKILSYEETRIEDFQSVLDDFIRSQIFYHSRALEALTGAYKRVRQIDKKDGSLSLARDLSMPITKEIKRAK